MAQGVFRTDPPPVQGAPHTPIPAGGSAPSPRGPLAVATLALLVGMWPGALEPRPAQLQPASNLAPLTQTYANPAPPSGPISVDELALVRGSWAEDKEPRLGQLSVRSSFAPLAQVYGNQPPVTGPISPQEVAIRQAWPEDKEPRLPQLLPASLIAPLTLTYGVAPVPSGPLSVDELALARSLWPEDKEPRLGQLRPISLVAPLTQAYGNPPVPSGPLSVTELLVVGAWQPSWTGSPQPQPTAGWNIPLVGFVPYTTPPASVLAAWQPAAQLPQASRSVAPLTLVYGNQPPAVRPAVPQAAWTPPWVSVTPPLGTAAWNVPLVGFVPFSVPPPSVLAAWQTSPSAPSILRAIAPLVLVYGDQPPLVALQRVLRGVVCGWWEPPFPRLAATSVTWLVQGASIVQTPVHIQDSSESRYAVADTSSARYDVESTSQDAESTYEVEDTSRARYEVDDDSRPRYEVD